MNILKEKCAVCNGSGLKQVFDDMINSWVYNRESKLCGECNGLGVLSYKICDGKPRDFLKRKIYIQS